MSTFSKCLLIRNLLLSFPEVNQLQIGLYRSAWQCFTEHVQDITERVKFTSLQFIPHHNTTWMLMGWALILPGWPFCYRIRAFPACCPPYRKVGACEVTEDSCPPLPVLMEYLCSETLVPGKLERLGNGLSRGYRPPDMSGSETVGLDKM